MYYDQQLRLIKITKKFIVSLFIFLSILVVAFSSFKIVDPTERGVRVTVGKISDEILEPGIHFMLPFVASIQTYDLTNIGFMGRFSTGDDAAVSKDLQSIGVDFQLFWIYDGKRIIEIAENYKTVESIQEPLKAILKQTVKDEIGHWTIQEIVNNQIIISDNIKNKLISRVSVLPIFVKSMTLSNFNWSKEYEAMVQKTMIRKQEVDQMKQEVALIEQSAQKKVKEAEADKRAAELKAQAKVLIAKGEADSQVMIAKGEAEAKKLRSDADAYEAKLIVENEQAYQKRWDYEVRKIHENKWDGSIPPNYIPLTATGGVVMMK